MKLSNAFCAESHFEFQKQLLANIRPISGAKSQKQTDFIDIAKVWSININLLLFIFKLYLKKWRTKMIEIKEKASYKDKIRDILTFNTKN